jgi:hypothetical protein
LTLPDLSKKSPLGIPWVLHPQIQPTTDEKIFGKDYVCIEHIQTFLLEYIHYIGEDS